MHRPTLKEVAIAANVTTTTVSKIINNKKQFSAATVERVKKAMEDLNYFPNEHARNFVMSRTNTIAYILGDVGDSLEIEILKGVLSRSIEMGYGVLIQSLNKFSGSYSNFLKNIVIGGKVDGIISIDETIDTDVTRLIQSYRFPFVMLENNLEIHDSVTVDNFYGGYLAGKHLFQNGKKQIGIVSGPVNSSWMQERLKGFTQSASEYGFEIKNDDIFYDKSDNMRSPNLVELGKTVANTIIQSKKKYDAFFVSAGDEVALGMMLIFSSMGFHIPRDIAFIGFDNVPLSQFSNPPLTTVSQNLQKMGESAFDLLQKRMTSSKNESAEHPVSTETVTLTPDIIVRESV